MPEGYGVVWELSRYFGGSEFNPTVIRGWRLDHYAQARSANEAGRMTTTAEGKGAEFLLSPNLSRPRKKRISCFMAKLCHH